MYQLGLTVRDHGARYTVVAHIAEHFEDGTAQRIAESEPLHFHMTENTSLDPFQAILEVATDALRSMVDSGFRPRYCASLF